VVQPSAWNGTAAARRAFPLLAWLSVVSFVALTAYLSVRLTQAAAAEASWADRAMSVVLLAAELLVGFHAVGFFASVARASAARARRADPAFAPFTRSGVAVLVAAYNEAEEVLDETMAAATALDYAGAHLYLLDDSTRPECRAAAERIAARYGATLVTRPHRAGYKAGAINELLPRLSEPYVAILDADQRPVRTWLTEVVPALDADPGLAFVQAPQVYTNLDGLPVARASQHRQSVFFEYICEGKSLVNAMFCCGSNVVFRRAALLSLRAEVAGRVHYLDETSVTEDFATSVKLHARGWRTLYRNHPYVLGLGPETLAAYFVQQMRWAMGTLGIGLQLLRSFLRHPRMLTAAQWWEYALSGSYYFTGLANLAFMAAPAAFVVFGVHPVRLGVHVYLLLMVPQIGFNLGLFLVAMRLRGVPPPAAWLATALAFSTFWTYTRAAVTALLGLRRPFGVTPKGVGGVLPLRGLLPELTALAVSVACVLAAVVHVAVAGPDLAYLVNGFWAAYNAVQLSTLFVHFNRPVAVALRPSAFRPIPLRA